MFWWLFGITPVLANADNYDWPRWRGPNGDGISNETDWNPEALAGGPKILWKVDIGAGHSNVAIKDNRLYTMAQDGNKNIVYCLNARNGKEIWRYTYECGYSAYGPQATPVIDGKYVYILSTNGDLLCFKAKNGEVRWKKNIVDEFRVEKLKYGYAQSPVIDGDIIILNINISGIAIDKNTGEKIWASDVHTDLFGKEGYYATPVFYDNKNKRCALLFSDSGLYSVEVETGKRVWFYELETPYVPNCVDPVVF